MRRRNLCFLIVSHFLINPILNFSATSTAMRKFLLKKVKEVVQVEIPLPESKEKHAYYLAFRNGVLIKRIKIFVPSKPRFISYIYHIFLIIFLLMIYPKRFDVTVACDNLSFISLLCFRKLKIIKRLIYYSIDYTTNRFESSLLNLIYHLFDRVSWANSDENWVVSSRQIEFRKKNNKFFRKNFPSKVVPIGFELSARNLKRVFRKIKYQLVFVGTLRKSAGPDIIIRAVPKILEDIPEVKVVYIGGGEMREGLEKIANELGIRERVEFLGRLESHKRVMEILEKSYIGLAPYRNVMGSLNETSDPGKIKLYFSCGLPVITTKVANSWKLIDENKAGVIVEASEEDLSKAVIKMLKSSKIYRIFRQNAMMLGKRFDVNRIFEYSFRNYL